MMQTPSPKGSADTEAVDKLIEASLVDLKPRHRRAEVRVIDALLQGPLRLAYDEALRQGDLDRSRAYVSRTVRFLSESVIHDNDAGVRVRERLLTGQVHGSALAGALVRELNRTWDDTSDQPE